jgi:unsaturated rhamnogalacturonyl hydrolase
MDQLRAQPRVKAGNYWHKAIYPDQVWLERPVHGVSVYALYERDFGSGDGL